MPTYDYICKACKHAFETFHSMSEVKRKCPECGKNALERQIGTGGAVIFKGSGFYQTDYRSESYKKAAAGESGSAAGAGANSGKGKESGGTSGESSKGSPTAAKGEAAAAAKPKSASPSQKPAKPAE